MSKRSCELTVIAFSSYIHSLRHKGSYCIEIYNNNALSYAINGQDHVSSSKVTKDTTNAISNKQVDELSTPDKIYDLYILEDTKNLYSPPFLVFICLMNLHFLNENHLQILHILKMGGRPNNHFLSAYPFSWTVGSFCKRGRQKTVKPMIPSLIDTGNCFEQFLLCSKFVKDFFLVYKHEIATFDTNSLHILKNWPFSALLKYLFALLSTQLLTQSHFLQLLPFFGHDTF